MVKRSSYQQSNAVSIVSCPERGMVTAFAYVFQRNTILVVFFKILSTLPAESRKDGDLATSEKRSRALSDVAVSHLLKKRVVSVFANCGWKVSSKSEGVKSPSEAVKVRGFADFRGIRVFAISQTARQKSDLRSNSGLNGNKKGNSLELPEMRWWSIGDLNS